MYIYRYIFPFLSSLHGLYYLQVEMKFCFLTKYRRMIMIAIIHLKELPKYHYSSKVGYHEN